MMRKLSGEESTGSMDLMLDVLTNVFGAVILIACLLAILPRYSAPSVLLPEVEARSEMIERRMESAKRDLEDLEREIMRLEESNADPQRASQVARRDSLKATLVSLEEEVDRLRRGEEVLARAEALSSLGRREELEKEVKRLAQEIVSAETLAKASQQKIEDLERRKGHLESQIQEVEEGKPQVVRFPREKGRTENHCNFILKHGRVYPLHIGKRFEENPAVTRTPIGLGGAFRADPLAGRGEQLPEASAGLRGTLTAVKRANLYVAIYVYPDSHEIFQELKSLIFEQGLKYGLEFVPSGRSMTFGPNGTKPPEL